MTKIQVGNTIRVVDHDGDYILGKIVSITKDRTETIITIN